MATATLTQTAVQLPRTHGVRHILTVERVLLGLCFFVFGLNGFFNFIPTPKDPGPEAAASFGTALMKAGYFFPLLKGVETLAGALLLANRFVPLALTLLAPILVNIVAFHMFLAPSGVVLPIALTAFALHLAWSKRDVFRPMLAAK